MGRRREVERGGMVASRAVGAGGPFRRQDAGRSQLFVESCYERGTLEEVLKDYGFAPDGNRTEIAEHERVVRIPLPLVLIGAAKESAGAGRRIAPSNRRFTNSA